MAVHDIIPHRPRRRLLLAVNSPGFSCLTIPFTIDVAPRFSLVYTRDTTTAHTHETHRLRSVRREMPRDGNARSLSRARARTIDKAGNLFGICCGARREARLSRPRAAAGDF